MRRTSLTAFLICLCASLPGWQGSAQDFARDFSLYQQQVPGMFFYLGINAKAADPAKVAENHSPYFFVDEGALPMGIRALANLAVDYLTAR